MANCMHFLSRLNLTCCALALLFPKVMCTSLFTWAMSVVLFVIAPTRAFSVLTVLQVAGAGLFYVLCIYTYFRIVNVGPGSPSDFSELHIESIEALHPPSSAAETSSPIPVVPPVEVLGGIPSSKRGSYYPFCNKCSVWKPARTHHCSRLGKCVLKMDHYCPWFSCCIGFNNYKFFVQFLAYVVGFSGTMGGFAVTELYWFFARQEYEDAFILINVVFLAIVGLGFFISIGCFLGLQVWLVLQNLTTIEYQDRRWGAQRSLNKRGGYQYSFVGAESRQYYNIYDLGYKDNWKSVMGPNVWTWLFPVDVICRSIHAKNNNGVRFEVNPSVLREQQEDAELQNELNRQLSDYKHRLTMERESLA